jgi:hypothetical protein
MSKIPSDDLDDDLLPEYDFDYSKSKPNRFVACVNQPLRPYAVVCNFKKAFFRT